MNAVVPNTDEAIDFLKHWEPNGPWILTAIEPDNRDSVETTTYSPNLEKACRAWIDSRQGRCNLYFSVNRPKKNLSSKATKGDIGLALALHIDIDARAGEDLDAERERIITALMAHNPPPSIVVASGGGAQGFWLFGEPTPFAGVNEIEDRNRGIEKALGGDHCFNIDRIMRLPGTLNLPDKKKRAKGRVKALAHIVMASWSRRYALTDFAMLVSGKDNGTRPHAKLPAPRMDEAPENIRALIKSGDAADHGGDRSKAVFSVVCELARCFVSPDEIAHIILDPNNGISAHVLDQPKPEIYARRQAIAGYRKSAGFMYRVDKKGNKTQEIVPNNQHNIRLALSLMDVTLSYDKFAAKSYVEWPGLPERKPLDDAALEGIYFTIDARFKFLPSKDFFWMFIANEARKNWYHPVIDYLDGLTWDGMPRIGKWLVIYGGAKNSDYVRAVGHLMLVAAVRRIKQPGCKFDEMLVLQSDQGKLKSSAIQALSPEDEWYTDDMPLDVDAKEAIERISGKWIVEAGELAGMRKGEVEHLKAFLSRRVDGPARMAYGRLPIELKRQSVLFGTTNSAQFLRDSTGNRRFWPVNVGKFDVDGIKRDRDQLWAEAAAAEAGEESIRLDPALYAKAEEEQEERKVEDPWVGVVRSTLEEHLGENHGGRMWTEHAWLIIDLAKAQRTQEHNFRLGDAMRALGWHRAKARWEGRLRWCYTKGTDAQRRNRITIFRNSDTQALSITTVLEVDDTFTPSLVN